MKNTSDKDFYYNNFQGPNAAIGFNSTKGLSQTPNEDRAKWLRELQAENPKEFQKVQDTNTQAVNNTLNTIAFDMDEYRKDEPSRLGMQDIESRITVPMGTKHDYLNASKVPFDKRKAVGIYTYIGDNEGRIFIPEKHALEGRDNAAANYVKWAPDLADTVWHEGLHKAFYEDNVFNDNGGSDPYFNAPTIEAQHSYIADQSDKHIHNRLQAKYVPEILGLARTQTGHDIIPYIRNYLGNKKK